MYHKLQHESCFPEICYTRAAKRPAKIGPLCPSSHLLCTWGSPVFWKSWSKRKHCATMPMLDFGFQKRWYFGDDVMLLVIRSILKHWRNIVDSVFYLIFFFKSVSTCRIHNELDWMSLQSINSSAWTLTTCRNLLVNNCVLCTGSSVSTSLQWLYMSTQELYKFHW